MCLGILINFTRFANDVHALARRVSIGARRLD